MQKRKVNRVDISFIALQITASVKNFRNGPLIFWHGEKFVIGQEGRLAGTHVREDDSACLLAGISEMTDLMPVCSSTGLSRLFNDPTANIVQPTVVKASKPAILKSPVAQVGSAVRAMQTQQARPSTIVAEQDQLFAENLYLDRRALVGQFLCKSNGLPVAAQ
jgi:hypothetical protein